jgi:hypothetical protein
MKVVEGLLNAKRPKPPAPKASPDGFKWPDQREAGEDVAKKVAASLQELLPARGWKHTDLAGELWGTQGPNDSPRNVGTARRFVMGELPIPNEQTAGYIAQVLDVPMARLLIPAGRFNPKPDMIRERSPNGVNKAKMKGKTKAKKGAKTASGRDREKQRKYNAAYRARKAAAKTKRKYARRAKPTAPPKESNGRWILADGVEPPTYTIKSAVDAPPGHVSFTLEAVIPHERAMAILHVVQTGEEP